MKGALAVLPFLALPCAAQIVGASQLLSNAAGQNQPFSGIGRFAAGLTCTAFWISTPTSSAADAPAYALSAGHCITLDANEVVRDRAIPTYRVIFNYFVDTPSRQVPIAARRVAWASMKGADLSVVELNATHRQLLDAGLQPVALDPETPAPGERVATIGAPSSGIPPGETFLRRAECTLDAQAGLIEYVWHFWSAWRNTCSDILPGGSGSPVLSARTGKAVAVMNTTNAGAAFTTGDFRCFNGQPCEIVPGGFRYRPDTNYAIPLAGVDRCFGADGVFDLALPGCPLDPGRQLTLSPPLRAMQPDNARWNVGVSGNAWDSYRYKATTDDCRNPQGYSAPLGVQDHPRIIDLLPETEGRYYLCVLGGEQEPRFATMVHTRVDRSPPTIPVQYLFRESDTQFEIQFIFVLPELVDYRYKIGETAAESCADANGYQVYRRVPIRVSKSAPPYRFCFFGLDEAGNASPPFEILLQGPHVFFAGVVNAASFLEAHSPGGLATIFGVNLTGGPVILTDAAGARRELPLLYAGSGQINTRLPEGAVPGQAKLEVAGAPPVYIQIEPAAPGIFTLQQNPFTVYTTGVPAAAPVTAAIAGVPAAVLSVKALPEGVQAIELSPPPGLHGYVPLRISAAGRESNAVTIRLR